MNSAVKNLSGGRGLLPLIVGLGLWQLLGNGGSAHFPPPSTWWSALVALVDSGAFVPALRATLSVFLVSIAVAAAVGFALGLLIGTLPWFRQWTGVLLEYFRAVPPPVIIPIAVLVLGYTGVMQMAVIGFAAFWPIMLNTISGVAQIRGLTFDVARAFRLSWIDTLLKVVVPATIPSLLLGIRVALPQAVIVTLVVEMFTGEIGIGSLMMMAQRNFNAPAVFGLLTVMGLFGFGLTMSFSLLERGILRRWPRSA